MSVADYMTPRLVVVSPKTTISVAVELMKKNAIHRLPVLSLIHISEPTRP